MKKWGVLIYLLYITINAAAYKYSADNDNCTRCPPVKKVLISGRVISADSTPLAFASVSLRDSLKEIAHTYCDSSGLFQFELPEFPDRSFVSASYLNEKSQPVPVVTGNPFITLVIPLKKEINEAALVTGKRPLIQKKPDRIIYTIENNPAFENKSMLDILKGIPRVTVSGNNIGILGQGVVAVMINNRMIYMTGKELTDYLNIFRGDIVSIEVIPNPPSNYDAEGAGGLINIITKKGKLKGLFGDYLASVIKNSYWQGDQNINLRFRNNNMNIAAGMGYGTGDYKETVEQAYTFNDAGKTGWQANADNKNNYTSFNTGIVIDYQVKKDLSLNLTLNRASFRTRNRISQTIQYRSLNHNDSLGRTQGNDLTENITTTEGFSLRKLLPKGKGTFDFAADFLQKKTVADYFSLTKNLLDEVTPTNTTIALASNSNAPKNILSFKADLSLPAVIHNWNVATGLKYTNYGNESRIAYDQLKNGQSIFNGTMNRDIFSYQEQIFAAYFSADKEIKKWLLKAGLRYEYTISNGHSLLTGSSFKNNLNYLFPSAFALYNISDDRSIGLSYSRRVSRPRIWDVNPYRWYASVYAYSVGNPALLPALQNNFDVSLSLWNKLFASAYFNIQENVITSLPYKVSGIIESRKENSGTNKNYGVNISYNDTYFKIIESYFSITAGSYKYTTPFRYTLNETPLLVTIETSQNINITPGFTASINFNASLPGGGMGILSQNGNYRVDFALRKTMLKNKINITFSVDDLFRSSSSLYTAETPDFSSRDYNYYDFRFVTLSLKYKFGRELRTARAKTGLGSNERTRL